MKKITILLMIWTLAGCYKESAYDISKFKVDDVISEIELDNTVYANSKDMSTINVFLNDDAALGTEVKIECSDGTFVESGKSSITLKTIAAIDEDRLRKMVTCTYLAGLNAGVVKLSFDVAGIKDERTITANSSDISDLQIIPETVFLDSLSEEIDILVNLSGSNGKPSDGQQVSIIAFNDNYTNEVGTFRTGSNKRSSNGQVSFVYTLIPEQEASGPIHLVATVPGTNIADTTAIYYY